MDPDGKVCLVTGGASGIGRATAMLLATRGALVIVGDVDDTEGAEVVRSIESDGGWASFLHLDVSSPGDMEAAFATIVAEHGAVDVVHNNAGIVSGAPDFPSTPARRIEAVVGVNVTGVFVGTALAMEAMSATGGGVIVNTASTLADATPAHTGAADPVYAATKAAVKAFTQLCAPLAARHGVRVNAVLPGAVDTPILAKTGNGSEPAPWLESRLREAKLISPDQVAAVVLALVEDEGANGAAVAVLNER